MITPLFNPKVVNQIGDKKLSFCQKMSVDLESHTKLNTCIKHGDLSIESLDNFIAQLNNLYVARQNSNFRSKEIEHIEAIADDLSKKGKVSIGEKLVINLEESISVATNLFYSKEELELPKIYEIINRYLQYNSEPHFVLKKLNHIRTACKILYELMRSISITKHNTIVADNNNFDALLMLSIENTISYLDKQITAEKVIEKKDPVKVAELIRNMMNDVGDIIQFHKMGGVVETASRKSVERKHAPSSAVVSLQKPSSNTPSGLRPTGFSLSELGSDLAGAVFGTISATASTLQSKNHDAVFLQGIGAEKLRVLRLCKQLKVNGYDFTEAQKEDLGKFFNIKRGKFNFLESIYSWDTDTYKEFDKIMNYKWRNARVSASFEFWTIPPKIKDNNALKVSNFSNIKVVTHSDISAQIIEHIKDKEFGKLYEYLNNLDPESQKLLPTLVFEIEKFRGNILTYVMLNFDNKYNNGINNLIKFLIELYENGTEKVEAFNKSNQILGLPDKETKDGEGVKHTIADLRSKNYDELSKLLRSLKKYSERMKYQSILDITHIVFAILTSNNLNTNQQNDLRKVLQDMLAAKDDGIFRGIRTQRNLLSQNLALSAAFYNVNKSMSYINDITNLKNTTFTVGGVAVAEGAFALLEPITEKISTWNTVTYENLVNISNVDSKFTLLLDQTAKDGQKSDLDLPDQAVNVSQTNSLNVFLEQREFSELTIMEIKDLISDKIEKKELGYIVRSLEKVDYTDKNIMMRLYYALTDRANGTFLLESIFDQIEDQEIANRLRNSWTKIIKSKISDEIPNFSNTEFDMNKFRQYLANVVIDDSLGGLIKVYEVMAMINCFEGTELKEEMAQCFVGIIYRARSDPTSKWYDLLKIPHVCELILRSAFRVLGWATSAVAITFITAGSHGLSTPATISILGFGGAIGSAISAISNNFNHSGLNSNYRSSKQVAEIFFNGKDQSPDIKLPVNTSPSSTDMQKISESKVSGGALKAMRSVLSENSCRNNKYSYDPKCDRKYLEELKSKKTDEDICEAINKIIEDISKQVIDKYTANQALFRIISIVCAGIDDNEKLLAIIISIATSFKERGLIIAQVISEERSFYTKNNYLIPHVTAGTLSGLCYLSRVAYLSGINIEPIYQQLVTGAVNAAASFIMAFSFDDSEYGNTKSFQNGMSFMKKIIVDLVIDLEQKSKSNSQSQTSGIASDHLKPEDSKHGQSNKNNNLESLLYIAKKILGFHTGRLLTRYGMTKHDYRQIDLHKRFKEEKRFKDLGRQV